MGTFVFLLQLARFCIMLCIYIETQEVRKMSDERRPTIEEVIEGQEKPKTSRKGWVGFVEGEVVNFMTQHNLEKMTLDDGMGNKAKLTRRKDNSIFVECTSSNVL